LARIDIEDPWDRDGTFDPKLVRSANAVSKLSTPWVVAVGAGLTTGEICAHLAEV
jgi:hypothetical protein